LCLVVLVWRIIRTLNIYIYINISSRSMAALFIFSNRRDYFYATISRWPLPVSHVVRRQVIRITTRPIDGRKRFEIHFKRLLPNVLGAAHESTGIARFWRVLGARAGSKKSHGTRSISFCPNDLRRFALWWRWIRQVSYRVKRIETKLQSTHRYLNTYFGPPIDIGNCPALSRDISW